MRRRSPASGPDRTQKLVGAISFGRSQEHHGATDERAWCRGAARARVLRVDHPILVDVPLIAPRQACARCPFLSPIASAKQRQTGNYRFGSEWSRSSFYSINIAEAAAKESAGGSQTPSNASEVSPCRSQLLELFRKPNLAPRCRVVAREKRLEVRQNCLLKRFAAFVCAHRRLIRP